MAINRTDQLSVRAAEQVAGHELFRSLDAATWASVQGQLTLIQLPAGAQLFAQGDPGDSMYLIVSGRLGVVIAYPDGREVAVDELLPGMTVGELALLTGHPRTASVAALTDAELVRCGQAQFDLLSELAPQAARQFAESLVPRLLRVDLAGVLTNLLGELEVAALHDLQQQMEWLHLPAGAALFQQGDPGDALYIVVTGRLRAVAEGTDGSRHMVGEISRGECVGEFALLTDEPRAATVYAARDSYLVRLSRELFERLVQQYPQVMLQLTRMAIRRLRAPTRAAPGESASAWALIPAAEDVPLTAFARQLAAALAAFSPTLHLSSEQCDRLFARTGAAQLEEDHPQNIALVGWLNEQATRYPAIVYEADSHWSSWTRRCLRHADRVLVVGQAGNPPAPGRIETAAKEVGFDVPTELVLIHPPAVQRPSGTRAWLSQRNIQTHHHLRLGVAGDFARLARRLTGRAVGLVMSGGGARGLAHIGAMRAFEEAGLRPDFVGGTSAGAVSAATYVTEYSYEQMLALARTWSARGKMLDYTLPITSLIATRKFTDLFRTMFGEVEIEDLWQRFFCISSNLTHAEPVIHTDGPLWAAVRASTAIPAVMAPLLDSNGDVLVDGGVMNNFPIDVMREVFAAGIVIGVDVAPPDDDVRRYSFGPSVSGWQLLWSKLVWRKAPLSAPSILEALFRTIEINGAYRLKSPAFRSSADLLIHVPLKQYGMFDFDMYPELIERGYQTVKQQLGAWNQHAAVMRWYGAP